MTNHWQKFTVATLGAALATLGSVAPTFAANLSFNLSGRFEPNPVGLESFAGTYSYDPDNLGSDQQATLSSYTLTFFGGKNSPEVWSSEDFEVDSFVKFQRISRGTTIYLLNFQRPEALFNLDFVAAGLDIANPDVTAAPVQFLKGGLVSRGFRDENGEIFSVLVSSVTVTAAQLPQAVPESGTFTGLAALGLGFLLKKKRTSDRSA
jgi:hypothetical protein